MATSNRGQVCFQFAQGTCNRNNCKFSHDISASVPSRGPSTPKRARGGSAAHPATPRTGGRNGTPSTPFPTTPHTGGNTSRTPNTPRDESERAHRDWRRSLGREGGSSDLSPAEMLSFLRDAISILETGSANGKQSVVKDLGSERGLRRIRQILETDFVSGYSVTKPRFYPHCIMFLKLISHDEMQSSLVLEAAVGTIYNVIYGHDGNRGITFFKKVSANLLQARQNPETSQGLEMEEAFEEALAATAAALLNTIRLNQTAAVRTEFKDIIRYLGACYDQDEASHSSFSLRSAHQDIQRIKERLQMGELITPFRASGPGPALAANFAEPFQLAVDLPGTRSRSGARHDNDHAFIQNIKVLPTTNEIRALRDDFLPMRGADSAHHLRGIHRLLDSQFRLLREDTAGQLRDGVRHITANWNVLVTGTNEKAKKKILRESQTHVKFYGDPLMEGLKYDRKKGLAINVSFNQPKRIAEFKKGKRSEWWKNSKELQIGSLVALISADKETTFLLVSARTLTAPQTENPGSPPLDLASNDQRAVITLCLTDPNNAVDQSRIVSLFKNPVLGGLAMVEFPGMLFVSFEPVLKVLQSLHVDATVPFSKWLIPQQQKTSQVGVQRPGGILKVPPPLYLVRNRYPLDLSCITTKKQTLSFSIDNPVTIEELEAKTTLDHGQCEAMITGLQNELALIQGPPGTGKSYVGVQLAKVLLANRERTKIGPIVCVCYTNHALDQFLEDLIKTGVKQIVRLGGRSKNEMLQKFTLQAINKGTERTKGERHEVWQCNQELDSIQEDMEEVCGLIQRRDDWKAIKSHLETVHPHYHHWLFNVTTEDGFTNVTNISKILSNWLRGRGVHDVNRPPARSNRPINELLQPNQQTGALPNIWNMSVAERARLKAHWEKEIHELIEQKLQDTVGSHTQINNTIKKQYRESDKRCLEQAHVIGVTTTGLATNSELLRTLSSKVLICEEAAEVLEAHVLTALLPSVQHAILIGDHLQLRPQVSNYNLSMESERGKKYGLDESLFERLANERFDKGEKFPVAQLDTQRRMYPSIASLVRETLYPNLRDHPETRDIKKHAEVPGMRNRLFWLDHRHLEDSAGDSESNSKTHEWEANMVVSLVRHLSRQGIYQDNDIAVLTPYLGQLQKLRKRLSVICELIVGDKDQEQLDLVEDSDTEEVPKVSGGVQKGKLLDTVRVSTVDNFQGDEAKVIIISLVRSNAQQNCGFLKTSNRINVLLSRARDGMYIIGNAETASSKVTMWTKVVGMLEDAGNIGPALPLCCPRHPLYRMAVSDPEDFVVKSPEGGCSEKCGLRLDCGHTCIMKCHSEPMHKATKCMEPCIRQHPVCGHSCPKRCHSPCGQCVVPVARVQLSCGHIKESLGCHESRNLDRIKCDRTVTKRVPLCGHDVRVPCFEDISVYKCTTICGQHLPCGHICNKPCSKCKTPDENGLPKVDHGVCRNECGRSFTTCNHNCTKKCHGEVPCSPCARPCEVRCVHSKCSKKCNQACPPCAEQCTWGCIHRERCTMPCAVPCDIIPCSLRCEKDLSCGHRCPGVCGEACPQAAFCRECASPEILGRTVDFIMYDTYGDVDIDEDPILFLTCGHFYTVSSLDGIMDLKDSYVIDGDGTILGPKPPSGVPAGKAPKGCPECRAPLRDIHRYNRVVKLALLDEATRRFAANAHTRYMALLDQIIMREQDLEHERAAFIAQNPQGTGNSNPVRTIEVIENYRRNVQELIRESNNFTISMARSEQPFGKVNSLVIDAKRRRGVTSDFTFDESIIQTGFRYRGEALALRLRWAILWDWDTIYNNTTVDKAIRDKLHIDILTELKDLKLACIRLMQSSIDANLPIHEIEARIYHAQFVSLELSHQPGHVEGEDVDLRLTREAAIAAVRRAETDSLTECANICARTPGTTGHLLPEIEKARKLLGGGTFYSFVSTEEQEQVYRAMASQFRGTGHWYYCENNHPFTVGECGMPMELARCPECGAAVGGQDHRATAGVRSATDFERQFNPAATPVGGMAGLFRNLRV